MGDYDYTMAGFILTILGTVLSSLKGIITNRMQVGILKLHPLDVLLRMSFHAMWQTLGFSVLTGEFSKFKVFMEFNISFELLLVLCMNGMIAFVLNIASFVANQKTSAVTMGVAGNIKQVLSIILAVLLFNLSISYLNATGILLTLVGGACYSVVQLKFKNQKQVLYSSLESVKS